MQYFDNSLSEQTFRVVGSRLNAEIDAATPRLQAIAAEQAAHRVQPASGRAS
jgi:hypothetical protein